MAAVNQLQQIATSMISNLVLVRHCLSHGLGTGTTYIRITFV